jgi:lysyl-tRNA synthetase, class II
MGDGVDRADPPDVTPADEPRGREAEIIAARRASVDRLRAAGIEPFALSLKAALGVTEPASTADVRGSFGSLGPGEIREDVRTLAGRIVNKRDIGKLKFVVLRDRAGDLQLVFDRAALEPESFAMLDELDLGDIVGVTGRVGTTRKGELSVFVDRWALLSKSLRPLPEKWHGLKDPDLQQRARELQLATDPGSRQMALSRASVLRTLRRELDARGFLEVETPVLQEIAGGALAKPFTTHHNALGVDLKLRISLELYLKRLLVGGLERVYEIGRNFRNEGIDRDHNPEFTMIELYQAYADYDDIMALTRELIVAGVRELQGGSTLVTFRGHTIDLDTEWDRVTLLDAVSAATGEKVTLARDDLADVAARHGVDVDPSWGPGRVVEELYDRLVEPTLVRPTFVCDYPREVSPLARAHRDDPSLTEHFDLVIAGVELATGFSELADPDDQRARFVEQLALRDAGDEEAHPLDEGFLRALEHGMPPAGGAGIGIDRLLMFLIDAASLRDLILFPQHRPE